MSWQQGPPGGDQPPAPPPPNYPPPGYGYGGQPSPGYNGLAIASLVVGISFLWAYGIGAILALIFGLIAKRQIRERGERGGALATAGIVLGIIGIAGMILFVVLIIVFADEIDEDDDFFDESLRRPAAVVWVSPDPVASPPSVVVVPARA
jgi:hypothetical protein